MIAAGTTVNQSAPLGYTHLIVEMRPRIGAGDVDRLPTLVSDAGAKFFVALVADVERFHFDDGSNGYRLRRIDVGLGTTGRNGDVIIASQDKNEQASQLGVLGKAFLSLNESRLKGMRITLWSGSLAIVDVPINLLIKGQHVPGLRRYAVLVDSRTGELETLIWFVSHSDLNRSVAIGPMRWLPPALEEDAVLHVKADKFSLGLIPNEQAIALQKLPAGKARILIDAAWEELAAESQFTEASAKYLERNLRTAMLQHINGAAHK